MDESKKRKEEEESGGRRKKMRRKERGGGNGKKENGESKYYLEQGNELLGANESEFTETLSNNVTCSLLLALAVLEQQCEDGGEVGLQDGRSCACCSLSHDNL